MRSKAYRLDEPCAYAACVGIAAPRDQAVGLVAFRFIRNAKAIDSDERRPGPGSRIDLALAALLVLLGCALFVYLSHAFVTKFGGQRVEQS